MSGEAGAFIKVGDFTVHCRVAGGGPPAILVHGLGASWGWWRPNIDPLAGVHRLFVLDLPGHGLSDGLDGGYNLAWGGQFLNDFMTALGLARAAIVGQSMGGLLALEMALRWPERVTRLVLVDSAGLGKELCWLLRALTIPLMGELMVAPTQSSVRVLMDWLFYNPRSAPEGFFADLCQERQRPEVKRTLLGILRSGVNWRGLLPSATVAERLRQLKVPTLILWGVEDRIIPVAHAYTAHRLIPSSELHMVAACGHCPQLERPDEFNEVVLDFLSGDRAEPQFKEATGRVL